MESAAPNRALAASHTNAHTFSAFDALPDPIASVHKDTVSD